MNSDEYKKIANDLLMREINRLKDTIMQNSMPGGMDIHPNLLAKIQAEVHTELRRLVPNNANDLFDQVIEEMIKNGIIDMYDNGRLRVM